MHYSSVMWQKLNQMAKKRKQTGSAVGPDKLNPLLQSSKFFFWGGGGGGGWAGFYMLGRGLSCKKLETTDLCMHGGLGTGWQQQCHTHA
jgi:hypothetical protein